MGTTPSELDFSDEFYSKLTPQYRSDLSWFAESHFHDLGVKIGQVIMESPPEDRRKMALHVLSFNILYIHSDDDSRSLPSVVRSLAPTEFREKMFEVYARSYITNGDVRDIPILQGFLREAPTLATQAPGIATNLMKSFGDSINTEDIERRVQEILRLTPRGALSTATADNRADPK